MNGTTVLWDVPTRLFHWLLVLAILLAWWTAEEGHMDWHEYIGISVLGLLIFRIIWGFIGSPASRFTDFLRGPGTVIAYMRGTLQRAPVGHNPLGGWSVVALISLLLCQSISGLFNGDDILFDGPLRHLVSSEWQDRFGVMHEVAFNGLLALILLHVLAVLWHQLRHKEPLIQAMIKGSAQGREGEAAPVSIWRAVVLVVLIAGGFWLALAMIPAPVSYW